MQQVRFIHAADLHLDAAFSGISREAPSELALRLQRSTFVALTRLVELCERERPDFLLLAGDIYNEEDQSLRAQLAVRDACVRLEQMGIPVFMVHGNHDPCTSRVQTLHWPSNVTIFGEEVSAVAATGKDGIPLAMIYGISHASSRETRNLAARFRKGSESCLHIGLLHATPGDADGIARYAPFSQDDLIASGMDYWALGHIHDRRTVCHRPLALYPGCLQGLHINESGEKGCLLVTMTPSGNGWMSEVSFHALSPVQWESLDVSLDTSAYGTEESGSGEQIAAGAPSKGISVDELEERLRKVLDTAADSLRLDCEALVVRLRLTGRTELDSLLRREGVVSDLLERLREPVDGVRIWVKDMEILTRLPADRKALTDRDDLLGEIFRLGDAGKTSPEQLAALREEILAPLFGHSRLRRVLEPLSEEELVQLVDDAESLCMDLLENS